MTASKKQKVTIRLPIGVSVKLLLKNFLEGYDYLSWLNRAASLALIISQPDFCSKIETEDNSLLGANGPTVSAERIVKAQELICSWIMPYGIANIYHM